MRPIKCVTVGDGAVGKTCLLMAYSNESFSEEYVPTVFDDYSKILTVDQQDINLTLWDTAGQEGYERLRVLAYPQTDVFLLCFSVVQPVSYENVKLMWLRELQHYCPDAQIVLVGTKLDLRNDPKTLDELAKRKQRPITRQQGMELARCIGAAKYWECSAKTREGVDVVFNEAIQAVLNPPKRKKKSKSPCCLL